MGRVLTNNISLSYVIETSLGVPDTSGWKQVEPNGVNQFGATITTVARNPISNRRQRRKGTVTDLDAAVEFEADLTRDAFEDFIEGFVFANFTNDDLVFRGADTTATPGYTIPSATAAQAAKLQFTSGGPISLISAKGYANDANNGLKPLAADVAMTDTEIQVAGLVVETAPSNAVVEIAGIRAEAGDLALSVSSGVGTLSSGNNAAVNNIDFTTLGLTVGQIIHVGGLTSANQFGSTSAGDGTRSFGYARVTAIAAGSLTLDKLDSTLVASDGTDDGNGGTLIPTDLLFGQFLRNVPVDDAEFIERSFHFEAAFPNLEVPGPGDEYEYAEGQFCNQVQFNLPLTDKATATFGFIGTDAQPPTTTRLTGASSPRLPLHTAAFNTSADFLRLRVQQLDETGLSTDFKSVTLTLNNNVSPEKVLGQLGAKFLNTGNFEVDLEAQLLFTNSAVSSAVRNNETVTMDFGLKNDDGALFVDIPAMTLGGGDREFPENESVLINTTGQAFEDPTLGTSIGISLIPRVP